MTFILFIIGFVILIKGADLLVDGASSVAKRFNISNLVIGLTVVAFGTSAPELAVNVISSLQGNSDIAIGNIVGSNIANILLILGVAAIIYPLSVKSTTVWKEIPFSLLAVLAVGIMANDVLIDGSSASVISLGDGLVLIGFFIIFLYYTFGLALQAHDAPADTVKKLSGLRSALYIIVGIIALVLGGNWIVNGAIEIATFFGISQSIIALTVIAIGTSLPELATSAVAAYKKETDIAIGNVVGSNIFNIFWILGISAVIKPLPFTATNNFDILWVIIATTLLFLFAFIGKPRIIERWQGVSFIFLYIVYVVMLVTK